MSSTARLARLARLAAALASLAAVGAVLARYGPGDRPSSPRDLPGWLAAGPLDERVVALAALGAWACLGWLASVLVAVACGTFPRGAVRDAAERVLGIAVVGVATGALVAGPAAADGPFDRPAGPAPPARSPAAPARPPSSPPEGATPESPARPRAPAPAGSSATPVGPGSAVAPTAPAGAPARAGPPPAPDVVVVAPGDTLWGIAARRLGPAASPALTAATWPRWYAANRPLIGPDPDLIRPGQRLVPPPDGGQR